MIKEIIETSAFLDKLIFPEGSPPVDSNKLNKGQRKFLFILSFYEGSSIGEIHSKMNMTKGNISIIADILRKEEFITCERETEDRRIVIARLTDKGRKASIKCLEEMELNVLKLFSGIKKSKLPEVKKQLNILYNLINEGL